MSKIIFTESRMLLDNSVVKVGEERDFGDAENSAFVQNGVAKWAVPLDIPAPAAASAQAISPEVAAAAQVTTIEQNLEAAIENKIHLQGVTTNV